MQQLKERTISFAMAIIKLCSSLPRTQAVGVVVNQLLRSGTSVGAQYHEATRSRSDAEFISKLESAQQELEETGYWLRLLQEICDNQNSKISLLQNEKNELMAIFAKSVVTVKNRRKL